jgi:hypothetical protein
MRKMNGQSSKWAQREAAKHTTPASIRQRIAFEEEQIRVLMGTSFNGHRAKALESHHELIRVLTDRLADF